MQITLRGLGLFHLDAGDRRDADDVHKVAGLCVHHQGAAILVEPREIRMRDIEFSLLGDMDAEWNKRRRVQKLFDLIGGHVVILSQRRRENKNRRAGSKGKEEVEIGRGKPGGQKTEHRGRRSQGADPVTSACGCAEAGGAGKARHRDLWDARWLSCSPAAVVTRCSTPAPRLLPFSI